MQIEGQRHRQIATEGALLGELTESAACTSGSPSSVTMPVSSRCCVTGCAGSTRSAFQSHTLLPVNEDHREDIATVRGSCGSCTRT